MASRATCLKHHVEVTSSGRRTLHIGSGDPLVLLHMGANPWSKWESVIPYLSDRFEIIAPTLAGWDGGNSLSGPITLDDLTRGVAEEMDRAGFRSAHIVGCSLGGLAALGVARDGRARSVLAMCPAGGSNQEQTRRLVKHFEMLNSLSWAQRLMVPVVLSSPRMRRVALRALVEDGGRISARQALAIRRNSAKGDWDNLLPGFAAYQLDSEPEVTVPFMLAWGEKDRFTPMIHEQPLWQKAVPHAESHVLSGVGHLPMFDDPGQTGRLMRDWLERHAAASAA
ncbi:alpha/beta hydrolase [Aeromicrobium sp. NPDC092404]|uniref:alpha/beta fold hydrolase n=1 Tax=Aeromicrobium sp. NPDC092404 TaxID=3154976 RepID=UPI003423BBB0